MSVLIGYVAKERTLRPPSSSLPEAIVEIASASDCIAERPDGWIQQWKHNDWSLYDSPELARDVASSLGAEDWPVVAYLLHPIRFDPDGTETPLPVTTVASPLPDYFARLGWDVVSSSTGSQFECSPLSCNGMAAEVSTNAVCLLPSPDAAIAFARRCAREQPEPGSYYVVEVWRERIAA